MSSVTNLAKNLTDTTRAHAGRVAVRVDNAAMTYRALDDASARVAGMLEERGIEAGDRVAIMLPNVPEFAIVYYGILRAGAIVVPMNPLLKTREVAYYLSDGGAKAIFAWHSAFEDGASAEVPNRLGPKRSPSTRADLPGDARGWPSVGLAELVERTSAMRIRPSFSTPQARPAIRKAPSSRTPICCRNAEIFRH